MVSEADFLVQGIDLGNDRSVTSILSGINAQPVLVRNNLSNDSTPTAVAFAKSNRRTLGDAAVEQPASNAGNVVSRFLPKLGSGESVSVEYGLEGETVEFSYQHCLAMFFRELQQHCITQQRAAPTHFIVAIPPSFVEAQVRAVSDAAKIAGLPNTSVTTSCSCLALHYAERHGAAAFPTAPEGEEQPFYVLFVDVGHAYSSASVYSYSSDKKIAMMSQVGSSEIGGDHIDNLLMEHFTQQLAAKHGADNLQGAKYEQRLRKASEKLKKLLSTVEQARVDADSLLPDTDCALSMTRKDFEAKIQPMLTALTEMIQKALTDADGDVGISGVEVVGGGARVPCVLETIKTASGQAKSRHTLDGSAAAAFGAASLGKLLIVPAPDDPTEAEGDVDKKDAVSSVTMEGVFLQPACEGMTEGELAAVIKTEASMRESDRMQREAQDARNALEEWVYSMRSALTGRSGHLLDREVVEALLDSVEEWIWGEGEDLSADRYKEKHEGCLKELKEKSGAYFTNEAELREAEAHKEREEEQRRKVEMEQNRSNEDHDNRVLKFAERYAMAEKNKNEGNELFKDGNNKFAAERYIKCLGHLAKLVHVHNTMREADHEAAKALKISCSNNLAQCFLKLEMWNKAEENCTAVIELDKTNAKALFRRAQARIGTKDYEKAVMDLKRCVDADPGDAAVLKLLEKTEKTVKTNEAKQKKVYSKMFG